MSDDTAWERWIARHVLSDLRAGVVPEGLTPARFSWNPTVVELRSLVSPDDRTVAIRLLEQPDTLMWGAFLARAFPDDVGMTSTLLTAFETETDIDRSIGLFHHLTARPLSDEQYQVLRSWIRANSSDFVAEQRTAFSDREGSARLRDRLQSDRPDWTIKRWVYMYSALALDPDEARSVLQANLTSTDSRVAEAAEHAVSLLA